MSTSSHIDSAAWEVHIVGYPGTDLSSVPEALPGFFVNQINDSTQGFSQIATWEGNDQRTAHQAFEAARAWSANAFANPNKPGVHVKLEVLTLEELFRDLNPFISEHYVSRDKPYGYVNCAYSSAWDIHFDGSFNPTLKEMLHADGGIILDYVGSNGQPETTITWHFLEPDTCFSEFKRLKKLVRQCGGFKGTLYSEHPLAFAVYGDTIPRPVIVG